MNSPFEQFCSIYRGNCGSCRFQEWDRFKHRTYCGNDESTRRGEYLMNNEGCDNYERKAR